MRPAAPSRYEWIGGKPCARIELAGAEFCTTRLMDSLLVIADDKGRILRFERSQERLLRAIRM
jgi:hypothetical protein